MKCKRCDHTNFVNQDYETENESEVMEMVKADICTYCGCAHWEDKTNRYWEFVPYNGIKVNQVAGWATNMN